MASYLFQSQRLGFRDWSDADLEPMTLINQNPKVMEHFPSLQDREMTKGFIDSQRRCLQAEGCCFFATDLLSSGSFIGLIGFKPIAFEAHFTPGIEIGWRIAQDHWGMGLATEGATACLHYAFETLNIDRIFSFTTTQNKRSESVMQKIGMRPIGQFDHPKLPGGHPMRRHVLYQITRPK